MVGALLSANSSLGLNNIAVLLLEKAYLLWSVDFHLLGQLLGKVGLQNNS